MTDEKLNKILEDHELWRKTGGKRGACADLSGADLQSQTDFMTANFEKTGDGYIAYKTFNGQYLAPDARKIEQGSVISEAVNPNRTNLCGCGINVAPLEWVKKRCAKGATIWKVLIRWEWAAGIVVPYNSDGEIRCERVELLEVVADA